MICQRPHTHKRRLQAEDAPYRNHSLSGFKLECRLREFCTADCRSGKPDAEREAVKPSHGNKCGDKEIEKGNGGSATSFSERMKIVPERQIQTEGIDGALRNRIINWASDRFDSKQSKYIIDMLGYRTIRDEFGLEDRNYSELIDLLGKIPWNKVYDAIECGYKYVSPDCKKCAKEHNATHDEKSDSCYTCYDRIYADRYSESINVILEQEKSGYRLINGLISPIIDKAELECIGEASNTSFFPVNIHLQKALQLYSDREKPDYENSIKESISAVEAMCSIITETSGSKATLGNTLKKLESSGIRIHEALKIAFEKIYGYTSDSDGIRHGRMDFKNAPAEDAKYMLVSCSAFVNYLMEKYSKVGGGQNGQDEI